MRLGLFCSAKKAGRESTMTAPKLVVMILAGVFAAVGLHTGSLHVIVVARLVAPAYEPPARIALRLVNHDRSIRGGLVDFADLQPRPRPVRRADRRGLAANLGGEGVRRLGHHERRGRCDDAARQDQRGREPWLETFEATRAQTSLPPVKEFVKHNVHVAKTWIKDRVAGSPEAESDAARAGRRGHLGGRRRAGGGLPRRQRGPACGVGRVHAPGLHRRVERGRGELGLPLPRVTLQPQRRGAARPDDQAAPKRNV
jgi:hypothetical protein